MNILNPVDSMRTKFRGIVSSQFQMIVVLAENGINVAVVIPFPQKPSPRMKKNRLKKKKKTVQFGIGSMNVNKIQVLLSNFRF